MQVRLDLLDSFLSLTVSHPEWFADPAAAQEWLEEEIMQLEAEQLTEIEDSRPARQLSVVKQDNVLIPSIAAWGSADKIDWSVVSRY